MVLSLFLAALAPPLAQASAQAPDPWTYAPVQDGGFGWRHNSVKREAGAVIVETLTYYGPVEAGRTYSWRVQTVRFDCAARNYTTMTGTYLTPAGKADGPVSKGMIWDVKDGSVENIIYQVLCNRANFTDGKIGADRAAVMKALATP